MSGEKMAAASGTPANARTYSPGTVTYALAN